MRPPIIRASFLRDDELVVDNFAGGGGASTGIEEAIGRPIDIAINHDPEALAVHAANHPQTRHLCENVWDVDPREACGGRPVGLAWFSPDCTFFSRARGAKPFRDRKRARRRRGLAWVVVRWAKAVKPRVLMMENVSEFADWGPLDADGLPDPARKGSTYRTWLARLRNLGYVVESRELVAADYGAPTTRKRLFLIARCDGQAIVWPEPTHAKRATGPRRWRPAAEIIDWSLPCPSIFLSREEGRAVGANRPLADATLRRIAAGVQRYVLESPDPFLVTMRGTTPHHVGASAQPTGEPLPTVSAQGTHHAVVSPHLVRVAHASEGPGGARRWGRGDHALQEPLPGVTCSNDFALIAPTVMSHFGESVGRRVDEPLPTVTGGGQGHQALIAPTLAALTHQGRDRVMDPRDPMPTVTCAHRGEHALIAPTLVQTGYGERQGQAPRALDLMDPLGTCVDGQKHGLVAAMLSKHYGGPNGHAAIGQSIGEPVSTVTARDSSGVTAALLMKYHSGSEAHQVERCQACDEPLRTIDTQPRFAAVQAFLVKFYSSSGKPSQQQSIFEPLHSVTTRARFGLVVIAGVEYVIADIGMRMLQPHELFAAQGFRHGYSIAPMVNGKRLTKTAQIRLAGNSVCPPAARALVAANLGGPQRAEMDGSAA